MSSIFDLSFADSLTDLLDSEEAGAATALSEDALQELVSKVHPRAIKELDPVTMSSMDATTRRARVQQVVEKVLQEEGQAVNSSTQKRLLDEVLYELDGFGPLEPLLNDPFVTEIMVNGPRMVYVERNNRMERTDIRFRDNAHVMRVIERIVAPLGKRIDESIPYVDARLPDKSRVNAIIPPLALCGPTLTIRKFSKDPYTWKNLVEFGTATKEMFDFLKACVLGKLNILVSGGTGSGKTTTLNVLSSFIPDTERIITIEDAAELQLQQEHVVSLETRGASLEGSGEVSARDLLRNSLRMRPKRIIVGECRGGEALDMLQAMNTGHDGSLSTVHANSPRDALARLETLVLMAGFALPSRAIREQIASAVHLFVQQNQLRDGSRRVTHITEVQGMEGDVIVTQDIFVFDQQGVDDNGRVLGRHRPTGLRPKCAAKMESQGVDLPPNIFGGGFMERSFP